MAQAFMYIGTRIIKLQQLSTNMYMNTLNMEVHVASPAFAHDLAASHRPFREDGQTHKRINITYFCRCSAVTFQHSRVSHLDAAMRGRVVLVQLR